MSVKNGILEDFVMNSIINSEISKTMVLTQYGAQALIDHIDGFGFSNHLYGQSVKCVPAQMCVGKEWYRGTADAVFQNLGFIAKNNEIDTTAILASGSTTAANTIEIED